MFKYLKYLLLILLLNSCVLTQNLNLDKEFILINQKKRLTLDSCSRSSYISLIEDKKYGKLFIEYINLDNDCKWNGLSRGYFVELFKSTIKVNSFELVERIDKDNIEINTYLIDKKYYVNIINKFTVFEDIFIVDYFGIYTDEEIKKFDKEYKNIYLNKPRFSFNYSKSLVNMNMINSYFSKESESYAN